MPSRPAHRRRAPESRPAAASDAPPSAPAVLSFLRETAALDDWTARDLSAALNISAAAAAAAIPTLEAAGYVAPAGKGRWRTTQEGIATSGAKTPRLKRASVRQAVQELVERARAMDKSGPRIRRLIVFGDYLGDAEKLQPGEIGVHMDPFDPAALRDLKARSPMIDLLPLEPWMLQRRHNQLLP